MTTTTDLQDPVLMVVDAPDSVQQWLIDYSTTLALVLNDLEHSHQPQAIVITLSRLWTIVESVVKDPADHTKPWSIAERGLPPMPDVGLPGQTDNWVHNAAHAVGWKHG